MLGTRSHLPESRLIAAIALIPRAASATVMLVGCLVLVGWMLDIPILKSFLPGSVAMKANTAAAFVLSGASLWLLEAEQATRGRRRIARICALIVALLGALTLGEYLLNWDLGIDQLFFREMAGSAGTSHSGRMAPNTALNFFLNGCALVLLSGKCRRSQAIAQWLAIAAALIALLVSLGYAYRIRDFYGIAPYTPMAFHTAVTFVALCAGILLTRPEGGVMGILTSDKAGGFAARRLLPAAIAIPSCLGWLILQGWRSQWYDPAFGLSLLVMADAMLLAILIWRNARTLDHLDGDRAAAIEALQTSESQMRLITDALPALIAYVDAQQVYRFNNKEYENWLGHPASEISGKHLKEVLGESAYAALAPRVEAVLSGETVNFEQAVPYKDGKIRYISASYIPDKGDRSSVKGYVALIQDITEQKRAREALQASEERYRELFENANDIIYTLDLEGNLTSLNKAGERLTGYRREELLGTNIGKIIVPEYLDIMLQMRDRKVGGEPLTSYELEIIAKDGHRVMLEVSSRLIYQEGKPVGIQGIARDISDRKRAEQALRDSEARLRRLVDSNIIGIIIADCKGNLIEANDAFLNMVGYSREEALSGQLNWEEITPPEHKHLDAQAIEEMKRTGSHKPFEKEYIRKDGSRVPILVGTAYLGGAEEIGVGFIIDLSEQKQVEQKLQELADRVREQAEVLDGILQASVDHIYIIDRAGRYRYVSAGGAQVLGYQRSDVEGKTWRELGLPADVMERFDTQREEVIRTVKPMITETAFLSSDGMRHYEYIIAPLFGRLKKLEEGKAEEMLLPSTVEGVVVISRDISKRKQAEAALLESREQLQLVFDSASLGTWDWNLQTGKVAWSGQNERLFGMEPGSFRGTYAEFTERVHPDDLKALEEALARCRQEKTDFETEYRVIWPDGSIYWLEAKGRFFYDENSQPLRMTGAVMDITRRKLAEEALRMSETRFRALVEQSPLSIQILDTSGRIVQVNRAWEELWGVTIEQIPEYNLLCDEQLAAKGIMPYIKKAFAGEATPIPAIGYDPNETLPDRTIHEEPQRWVRSVIYPVKDEGGNIREVVLIHEDISDRVLAEEALKESEARFRRLFESNIIGLMFADARGNITEANDAFLQTVGYAREDLMAGKVNWSQITPPEYRHLDEQAVEEAAKFGACKNYEKELRRSDGTCVPVIVGGARLGNSENGIGFVLDLTERKRAEEALHETNQTLEALVRACPLAITVFNVDDGKVKLWNPAAERIFGWGEEEALGQFLPSIPNDKRGEFLARLDAVRHGEILTGVESRRQKKDGSPIDIAVWAAPLRDAKGNISCMSIVADISDRVKLEAERARVLVREQQAREQAEAANRMKDEFLATLSHELRTPLNAILGWAQLLRVRKFNEAKTAKAIETIERNSKSLSQLIEDVLDVSRIVRGKMRLNIGSVELASVIEAAIDTVRPAADAKEIFIQMNIEKNAGPVKGDATRLQQVIWNLLANAVKFTPKGGRVEVRLSAVVGDGVWGMGYGAHNTEKNNPSNAQCPIPNSPCPIPHTQIQISDTGMGISAEFLPFVFDRFRQADGSITRSHGGLGLGLAIVRHLVEMHGGTVRADSPGEGQGATFTVTLPLSQSVEC